MIVAGKINGGGIGRPGKRIHPAIEVLCQVARASCLPLVEKQSKAVAFVSGARLRTAGDKTSIGRVQRSGIASRTAGDFLRRPSRNGNDKYVVVGAGRFH